MMEDKTHFLHLRRVILEPSINRVRRRETSVQKMCLRISGDLMARDQPKVPVSQTS